MENEQNDNTVQNQNNVFNANSASSGNGTTRSGGTGEAGKLSDYPDGNLGNIESEDRRPEQKSVGEATDPSKLSDI